MKVIDNHLINYTKVRDVQIKSEQEAYKEILDGKFQHYPENKVIETLQIHNVEVSFHLDSKGYYQPVYAFHCTIDGMETMILFPGFRKHYGDKRFTAII